MRKAGDLIGRKARIKKTTMQVLRGAHRCLYVEVETRQNLSLMQGNSFRDFSFIGIAKSCIVEFGFCFDIEMWVYLRIPSTQTKKKKSTRENENDKEKPKCLHLESFKRGIYLESLKRRIYLLRFEIFLTEMLNHVFVLLLSNIYIRFVKCFQL